MFVKNTQKIDIELSSFEGFQFTIPPGVSYIYDKAGEHLLSKIYKVETPYSKDNKDKYGFDNGHGVPPLLSSTEKEWEKEGKKLTQVKRFKISEKLIPRAKLITLAKQRGVDDGKIMEYLSDPNLDANEIVETINNLPVPESIRYPSDMISNVPETANA